MKELTGKQSAFIDEYFLNGLNATIAYCKIYNCNYEAANANSARLMNDREYEHVQNEIKRRQKKLAMNAEISREEIIKELKAMIEECKTDKDRSSLLKAIDQLNKMAGHYTETKNINIEGPIKLNFGGGFTPNQPAE